MRVLVLDNYDSFVFNLVQYLGELGAEPVVHRNDAIDVDEAVALEPDGVLRLARARAARRTPGIICDAVAAFADRRHAGARRVPRPPGDRPRLRGVDRRRRPS